MFQHVYMYVKSIAKPPITDRKTVFGHLDMLLTWIVSKVT